MGYSWEDDDDDDDGDGDSDDGGDGGDGGVRSCQYCDITCSSVRELRRHQADSHLSQLEILQCDLCSFVTHWEDSLALHRRSHEVAQDWSQVKCEHCHYVYAYNPGQARSTRRDISRTLIGDQGRL